MIKAVTFDLWNTLMENKDFTEPRINSLKRDLEVESLFFTDSELLRAYNSASDHYRREWEQNHSHLNVERRVEHILKELRIPFTADLIRSVIDSFMNAYVVDPPALKGGVEETLEALNGEYRMGIISDTGVTPGSIICEHLEGHELLHYFTSTVFSDEVGYCKPDPKVFEKALNELKVRSEEAIHVGDLLRTDVAGAKGIGMKAVWVSDTGDYPHGEYSPDFVIKRLPELLDVIEKM
ncbi:HAD family hydrolase [Candidatus Bathyarchaeota archaeon]|nr:HAD family hydrolase [Candidatus Bathyarchaeota archaeon]